MIKVLYVIDTLEVGGAEKSLLDILSRFQVVEPTICHLYPGQVLKSDFEKAGIKVISLNLSGKYSFISAISEVRRLVRKECPDLIHSTLFRSDIVSRISARLENTPIINSFVNDTYANIRWQSMTLAQRFKHQFIWFLDRITAQLVTEFTANSEAIKNSNCRSLCVPVEKCHVIYRGRDLNIFSSQHANSDRQYVDNFDLPPNSPIILNVGRLIQRKGQDELISAMPLVIEEYPTVQLLIVGEGPFRPVLEKLIDDLNLQKTVHLLGTRHDVPLLLNTADLFVSPSHYEGLPGTVVEAMFSGVPVVLSDMDVHREMLGENEIGKFAQLKDIKGLAKAIIEMLDNPELTHAMSMKAQDRARKLFGIDNVVAQHEKLYKKVFQQWK